MNKISNQKSFLAIISLLISIFIWLFAVDPVTTMTVTVPVEVVGLEGNDVIENKELILVDTTIPNSVDVTISGRQSYLENIDRSSFECKIDFSLVESGEQEEISIDTYFIEEKAHGVRIVSQYPKKVDLNLDIFSGSTIPLEVNTTGTPAEGFVLRDVELDNKYLQMSGSNSVISQASKAVVTVDVSGLSDSFQSQKFVKIFDKDGNEIEALNKSYKTGVRVNIARELNVNPVIVGETDAEFQYVPGSAKVEPEKVYVYGDSKYLKTLTTIDTEQIDISNLKKSTEVSATLIVPENVRLEDDVNIVDVVIPVHAVGESVLTISKSEIKYLNKSDALDYTIDPKTFRIRVEGTASEIAKFKEKRKKATVDVSGLVSGSYEPDIEFDAAATLKITIIDEISLDVYEK